MFPLYRSTADKLSVEKQLITADTMSAMIGHHVRDDRPSCPPNLIVLKPFTQTTSSPTPSSRTELSGEIARLADVEAHGLGDAADILRARLGPEVFNAWFFNVAIEKVADQTLTISAPTRFIRSYIVDHFADDLLAGVKQALGVAILRVEIVVAAR